MRKPIATNNASCDLRARRNPQARFFVGDSMTLPELQAEVNARWSGVAAAIAAKQIEDAARDAFMEGAYWTPEQIRIFKDRASHAAKPVGLFEPEPLSSLRTKIAKTWDMFRID